MCLGLRQGEGAGEAGVRPGQCQEITRQPASVSPTCTPPPQTLALRIFPEWSEITFADNIMLTGSLRSVATSRNITCSQLISVLCPPSRPIARSKHWLLSRPGERCVAQKGTRRDVEREDGEMEIANEIIFLPVLRQGCTLRRAGAAGCGLPASNLITCDETMQDKMQWGK